MVIRNSATTKDTERIRPLMKPGGTAGHAKMFTARHEHRVVDCSHNLPWEAPDDFANAILTVRGWTAKL
jgi:hypothetical protein